jgi:eukaryotic-like serine/threonine-protein kinase
MTDDVFGIVGSVIAGAYHVESVVAEGGFGVVYRAHHGGFRAPVALKLLKVPQQSSEQRAEFLELFRAEAELLFRLSASLPTVVRPLHVDAFQASDGRFVPYIVMEWLEGLTLDALIKQRNRAGQPPVALRKLVRLLTPVARALERAHNFTGPEGAISVVHRDLKPENIFIAQVAGEEVVKILDFGIGKVKSVASQVAGRMSQDTNGPMAFTPAYGAPEQWAPRHYGQTGPWTDVWGLALCIVETLAARPLIEGDPAAMMGITLDPARRPTPRNEGVEVSDAVEAVFARALALDPRARQRDAGLFWNELTAALQAPEGERGRIAARDVRSEDGRGPRIELVELPSRPPMSAPRVSSANPAVESALAMDLEFDPLSSSGKRRIAEDSPLTAPAPLASTRGLAPALSSDSSGQHFVPDLELAPPSVSRRASGARPLELSKAAAQPSVLDLDDAPDRSASLDLDLPSDEPLARRAASSPRMAAVQAPAQRPSTPPPRSLSGSMTAQRDSTPPLSGASKSVRNSAADLELGPNSSAGWRAQPRGSVPPAPLDAAFIAKIELDLPRDRTLMRRLRLACLLIGAAVLVAILDPIYAAATGEVMEVAGLRLSIFAGALLLVAVGLGVREALRES